MKMGNQEKKRKVSMGGQNKLTDVMKDHVQFYFQVSINKAVGKPPEQMRNEILAILYHCASTDENPQHHLCAPSKKSWCFYNGSLAHYEVPKVHLEMKVYFHLSDTEFSLVKNVYDMLTTDKMMKRCQKGLTQNRNESLHHRLEDLPQAYQCQ